MFIFMYCYILSIGFFSCWRLYCSFTVPVQTTPISSEWSQSLLPISVWLHSRMLASFPVHMTSSNQIDPLPGPKLNGYACALKGIKVKTLSTFAVLIENKLLARHVPVVIQLYLQWQSQLFTHGLGARSVELVVTNRPPQTIQVHLNTATVGITASH